MKKVLLSGIAIALLAVTAIPAVSAREADVPADALIAPAPISGTPQLPNPFVDVSSMQDAANRTGFSLAAPQSLPGYPSRTIQVMDNSMIQVIYQNPQGKQIVFRKAAASHDSGSHDLSGDYRQYAQTTQETIGGVLATVKRNNARAYVALWNRDGYSYAITSSHGLDLVTLNLLIRDESAGSVPFANP